VAAGCGTLAKIDIEAIDAGEPLKRSPPQFDAIKPRSQRFSRTERKAESPRKKQSEETLLTVSCAFI